MHSDQSIIEHMLSTMDRRGPDDNGCYEGSGCTLLHTRLAIIDPEGGSQPMMLQWGGESFVMVYNGELYNTDELRKELEQEGHCFQGHSDTEVLLHCYVHWGEDMLKRLNGIYSFAVWEEGGRKLFMARDRIGVKPLFFAHHGGGLLFASEIKTILAYPSMKAQLDEQGAAQVLLLGPGRIPGSGVFHNICELEPGFYAVWRDGHLTAKRYWYLKDREHTDDLHTTLEKVRYFVEDAICRQMVSDVSIGCFLSGGLDSSIISAICAREMKKAGKALHTFSVDYQDNDKYFVPGKFQPNSDNAYIQLMQETLGTIHHWTVLQPETLLSCMEAATEARDLPGMADVDFSLLAFCGDIREHVKVALSGECADEIFGGYPWYRDPQVRDQEGFPWAQNTVDRVDMMAPTLRQRINGVEFIRDQYDTTLRQADILPGNSRLETRMKQMVNLNFRWFMQTLLDRKDRMSMFHGLEVRVPFCDYRIAEYLYSVPWDFKDYQGREKGLLREAVKDLLPEPVLFRKKSPYPKTYHPQYTRLVKQRLDELLRKKDAPLFMLFSQDALRNYLDGRPVWPWYGQLMTYPQTIAYILQVNYWLEHYQIELLY